MKKVLVLTTSPYDSVKQKSSKKRILLLPNPFPPKDIYELVAIGASMASLAPLLFKLIKLWMEDRKARKIVVKKGDTELEIHGGVSHKQIKSILVEFRRLAKIKDKNEVEVYIPKNCNPELPEDAVTKAREMD